MKIGIITLLGNNYGNRLQNYAVQELLREYGDVYTVPYEKKVGDARAGFGWRLRKLNPVYARMAADSRLLNVYHLGDRRKGTLSRLTFYLQHKGEIASALARRELSFRAFDEAYISYEKERLHITGDDEADWVRGYDAWVCGSDQIWNPTYPTATRLAFLQFAPEARRVALAASIGLEDPADMPKNYEEWLAGIPSLSVREDAAACIVRKLTGRDVPVLLDPTMLLPRERWDDMADAASRVLPGRYALCYFLGAKERACADYIDGRIRAEGLDRVDLLDGGSPQYLDVAPDEMVRAIRGAEVVFTDSFHGAVFSILYHKQFVVFERYEDGKSMNSRFDTLLGRFQLEHRVFSEDIAASLEEPIDYSAADETLERERLRTRAFLDEAFSRVAGLPPQTVDRRGPLSITRKENCCGCTACEQACPAHCITMRPDEEGFLYPVVDRSACVGCGRCRVVCPWCQRRGNEVRAVYAAICRDQGVRTGSSSGGVFHQVCQATLSDGGVAFGCAWDERMVARHRAALDMAQARGFQGSKYVQSFLDDTFAEVREAVKSGKEVLFSGTPCQVAGLKNYLGRDYPNLFLVDVLCHGVPSPKLLAEYIALVEREHGAKVVDMNLRDKRKSWHRLHTSFCFEDGRESFVFCGYDTYMSMFLTNMSLRPSCYECKLACEGRQGDITLGDFWGIGKHIYDMDDDKGTSMVAVNTEKGEQMWERISPSFIVAESDLATAEDGNKVLLGPTSRNPNRDAFYEIFASGGYEEATCRFVRIPGKAERLYYDLMRKGLDLYRRLCHVKY